MRCSFKSEILLTLKEGISGYILLRNILSSKDKRKIEYYYEPAEPVIKLRIMHEDTFLSIIEKLSEHAEEILANFYVISKFNDLKTIKDILNSINVKKIKISENIIRGLVDKNYGSLIIEINVKLKRFYIRFIPRKLNYIDIILLYFPHYIKLSSKEYAKLVKIIINDMINICKTLQSRASPP